jgi:hypothetical protein
MIRMSDIRYGEKFKLISDISPEDFGDSNGLAAFPYLSVDMSGII